MYHNNNPTAVINLFYPTYGPFLEMYSYPSLQKKRKTQLANCSCYSHCQAWLLVVDRPCDYLKGWTGECTMADQWLLDFDEGEEITTRHDVPQHRCSQKPCCSYLVLPDQILCLSGFLSLSLTCFLSAIHYS